jgi:hypothetical protein
MEITLQVQGLKLGAPGDHFTGSRVETRHLSSDGSTEVQLEQPHLVVLLLRLGLHGVALQVEFERQTLKPGFPLDRF